MKPQLDDILTEELALTQTLTVLYFSGMYRTGWVPTTVGVRQGCILSPCLFNVYLEQIMPDALHWRQNNIYLRFAVDIDLLAGSAEELADITERLDITASAYGKENNRAR